MQQSKRVPALAAARDAYEAGHIHDAMEITKQHLHQHKDDGRGWEMIGLIQFSRGRFQVSVSALERAALFVPLRPAARVCLAHGYARVGRQELSRDLLAGLIDDESLPIPLLLQVATGLDAINQPGLAMRACRVASERDPDQPQPYYDMGYYVARCGYPPSLTESLARKAIALDPQRVCYRVGLASLLMKQNRDVEAYEFVQCFTSEQIERIACRCCLERIVSLFRNFGDMRRVVLCKQQLLALEVRGVDSDCD